MLFQYLSKKGISMNVNLRHRSFNFRIFILYSFSGLTNLLSDSNLMEGVIDIGDDDEFSVTSASDM